MPTIEQNKEIIQALDAIINAVSSANALIENIEVQHDMYIDTVGGSIDVDFFLEETEEGQQWERSLDAVTDTELKIAEIYECAENIINDIKKDLNDYSVIVEETGIVYEPDSEEESEEESDW